ncbi:MAG: glycerate kinase, partial [Anaerolineae bacterium]|nr:glycerate kinase [Anaerolineae bacterium]
RNQELALAAVNDLADLRDVMLITLATDGEDGPTDAAGVVLTGESFVRAQELGLDVEAYLCEHNAYHFFDALDDLLKPGSTGTNVNDLTFFFGF